jgi:WD40 repeat protein
LKKLILFFALFLFGQDINFDAYISKVDFNKNYLVVGLENGEVYIKDFNNLKTLKKISLPKIEDFMGDKIAMPIYSIDILDNKVLLLCEIQDSKRRLFIYDIKKDKMQTIFTSNKTYMKAKFITKNKILLGLLSDEISLYNLDTKKVIYTKQVGSYVFSNFDTNVDNSLVVFGDESGALKLVKINDGNKIKEFKEFNKDQTISLAFYNKLAINGSSDKKVSLINVKTGRYLVKMAVKFLPYAVAISPNEKYFAVQYNEKNDIAVFDINKKLVKIIKGQTMPLNGMRFVDNNTILSFSADKVMIKTIKQTKGRK